MVRDATGTGRDVARDALNQAATGAPLILLVIVPRGDTALHDYLVRRFAGVLGLQIILDRRQGERRRESRPAALERRGGRERRQGRHERHFRGYTFVTVESPDD